VRLISLQGIGVQIGFGNRLCGCNIYANIVTEVTQFFLDCNHLATNKWPKLFALEMHAFVKCVKSIMNTAFTNTNRSLRFPIVAAALIATAFFISSARTATSVHAEQGVGSSAKTRTAHHQHWFQFGRASWYGHALQGLPTATGEAYDMNAMTCAHRTLPLGSLVRVTNLRNHRSLVLRVNDRGPMIESRVVDLSYAAAKRLGFSHLGTVRVRIDLVDVKPSPTEVAMLTKPAM
jgi:rare lipoprotein A